MSEMIEDRFTFAVEGNITYDDDVSDPQVLWNNFVNSGWLNSAFQDFCEERLGEDVGADLGAVSVENLVTRFAPARTNGVNPD